MTKKNTLKGRSSVFINQISAKTTSAVNKKLLKPRQVSQFRLPSKFKDVQLIRKGSSPAPQLSKFKSQMPRRPGTQLSNTSK